MADLHTARLLHAPRHPEGWVLYLAPQRPARLVVFVHGFRGRPVSTWNEFADSARIGSWWQASDMLFVGYDSVRESIVGVAGRVRDGLGQFYPSLPDDLLSVAGARLRPAADAPYEELILVGHSLGGLVIRRILSDVAQDWLDRLEEDASARRPALLDAQVRLFSPASAGFRAAGWLGMAHASPFWLAVNMYLRRSSAYTDLQPGSSLLEETQRRTEALVRGDRTAFGALRARIVWANPEDVVRSQRYDTDYVEALSHGSSHGDVCKPSASFTGPWGFVETGHWR